MSQDELHREKSWRADYRAGSVWILSPVFIEIGGHDRRCGHCEYCEHDKIPMIQLDDAWCELFQQKLKVEHTHVGEGFTDIIRCPLCVVGGHLAHFVKNTYGTGTLRSLLKSDQLYKELPADPNRDGDPEKPRPLDL